MMPRSTSIIGSLGLKRIRLKFAMALGLSALLGLLVTAQAATNIVRMGNYWFSPTNISINVGDSITWSNASLTAHDSSGTNNPAFTWDSPLLAQRDTWTLKFTNAGYYPYFCKLHVQAHPEQTGSVTVAFSGNLAPMVAITNPPSGSVLIAPATFTLQASATDSGGSVSQVEFFNGANAIGLDTSNPYSAMVNNLAASNYTFFAVATDNLGAKATNSVSIVVNNPPIAVALVRPELLGTAFRFSFLSESNRGYTVQHSVSLAPADWQALTNFTGDGSVISITDSPSTAGQRWYRVRAQ